jgi:uncharacterized caspase-like protein
MKLHAAFIGINSYKDKRINSLRFARSDAEDFYTTVEKGLSKNETSLSILTDKQATKQNILELIGEQLPRRVVADDIVLLFFAGHGTPEIDTSINNLSRYLVPYDTKYDSIFATAIDMEHDLTRLITRIQANLIVVILDTCFSGQAGGRTFEGPTLAKYKVDWRSSFKLSNLQIGEGRIILSASDSNELAREDSILEHGVFTFFMLQTLTNYASDWISLNTLYDEVSQRVRNYTKGRQNPVMNGRVKMARLPVLLNIKSEEQ